MCPRLASQFACFAFRTACPFRCTTACLRSTAYATCVRQACAPTASSCCAARMEAAPAAELTKAGVKARLVIAAADGAASSDGSWLRSSRSHTSSTPSSRPAKRTAAVRERDVSGQVSRQMAWQGARLLQGGKQAVFSTVFSHSKQSSVTRDCWAYTGSMCDGAASGEPHRALFGYVRRSRPG